MKAYVLVIVFLCGCTFVLGQQLEFGEKVASATSNVRSIDPKDEDYTDLKFLKESIGDSRIVMLGELDHGDGLTFLAKTRLIKYLHKEMGFNVLAFETGLYEANAIWNLITKGEKDVTYFRENFQPVWSKSKQVTPLFDYINEQVISGDTIKLVGFDCTNNSRHARMNYVSDLSNFIERNGLINNIETRQDFLAVLDQSYTLTFKKFKNKLTKRDVQLVKETTAEIIQELEKRPQGAEIVFWKQEMKNIVADVMTTWVYKPKLFAENNIDRDMQMGGNLDWLSKKFNNEKIIVWAHNYHIAKNINKLESTSRYLQNTTTMHDYLIRESNIKTYGIGFTSYEGTTGWSVWAHKSPPMVHTINKPSEENLASVLAKQNVELGFVDLNKLDQPHGKENFKMRGFGYWSEEYGNWAEIFNGIFFIKTMSHSERVD